MTRGRAINRLLSLSLILFVYIVGGAEDISAQNFDTIPIPLYIGEVYAGEISVTILEDDTVQVRPSELIAYLEKLMSDEAVETARKIFPASGWLDLTEMGGLGVRIRFQFEDLTMHITIPPHLLRETTVSLTGGGREPTGTEVGQADVSAFLNLELWNRFTYETGSYDFSASPELALNIFGWVTEAKGGIQTGGDLFYLDYARITKDFPSIGYRLEAGDLSIPITDLSSVSNITGISFRRNFRLQPGSAAPLPYAQEIFIREPSKIEVYVNDRKIREKDYPSGSYVFRDFPLSRGINNVTIRWEDSEGPHEESLIVPFETNMLKPGEFDLGIAAGIPDRKLVLPSVSSYQYLGLTDNLTFGITESFDISRLELNLHPDFLLSTDFGNFNIVPVWGIDFDGGQTVKAGINYQMLRPALENYQNFGGGAGYEWDSMTDPAAPLSLISASAYYNFVFGDGFSLTPDLYWGYRINRQLHIFQGKLTLKKSIRGGSALAANIGFTYDEEPGFTATISYSSSFPDLNQNIYILENLETQRLSAFWNRYTSDENDFSVNASTEIPMQLDEKLAFGLNAAYTQPWFSVSGGHDFSTIIANSEIHNATSLRLSSALVFADGYLLLSKPVSDSFIIVDPGKDFGDQLLRVNPSTGGSDLELSGNPGLLPNINSFAVHRITVEPEELAPGMDDSGMRYLFNPGYKSAAVIKPEAEVLIFIGGIIRNADGKAVEAAYGNLTGKTSGESIDFFTDESGYFEAYGLDAEEFELHISGIGETLNVDLSGKQSGFHDIGTLILGEEG